MGFPPPPDAPSPDQQSLISADASFEPSPLSADLCNFKFPFFKFSFGLHLPSIPFPPPLPTFFLSLGINCSLDNPLDVTGGVAWGGGRVATFDPDPDDDPTL